MLPRPSMLFSVLAVLLSSTLFSLPAQGAITVVEARNFFYAPASISVLAGDTVRFVWVEGNHPTASLSGAWSTFALDAANPQFDLVLTATGVYPYECVIHAGIGMTGSITVTAGGLSCNSTTPPFGLSAAPGSTSALVSWAVLPNTNLYQVRGREVGTTGFRKSVLSGTSLNAPGLMPGSSYEWQVRALCTGTDALTPWSSFAGFTTSTARSGEQQEGRAWASPEGLVVLLPEQFRSDPVSGRLYDGLGRLLWTGSISSAGQSQVRIPYNGEFPGRAVLILQSKSELISIPLHILMP